MFEVFLTHRAEMALKSLDVKVKRRIETVLDDLAYTYFPKKYNIKKLKGVESTYRIRIMNYRITYAVDFKKSSIMYHQYRKEKELTRNRNTNQIKEILITAT